MLPFVLFLAMAPHQESDDTPPSGPPERVSRSTYSGGKIQIDIDLGDPESHTRLYEDGSLLTTLDPGVRAYPTGRFSVGFIAASHYRNGIESELTEEDGA